MRCSESFSGKNRETYFDISLYDCIKDEKIPPFKGRLSPIPMVYWYPIARDIHNKEVKPVSHYMCQAAHGCAGVARLCI